MVCLKIFNDFKPIKILCILIQKSRYFKDHYNLSIFSTLKQASVKKQLNFFFFFMQIHDILSTIKTVLILEALLIMLYVKRGLRGEDVNGHGGRRGTTDDVALIPFHPSLSSTALMESPNSIPVHSLILSSHLFFCLPLLLAPFTVPFYWHFL